MSAPAAAHPLAHLVGKTIPDGVWRLADYENWLGHDALYSTPEEAPHPVMAFVAAQRGLGVSVAELFRMWGTEMSDGPMLTESTLEFPGEFEAELEYRVTGTVESVVRKSGRTMGEFDLLTARFELVRPGGGTDAVVRNVYALPRRGEGG
ncbi:hypothetical protein [Actinomadura rugatobispora]|uniref:MaoC family dehydratase n=1 Tax=Actinomadura rugatobispora TaxID=1994 RepID=A0ABW1A5G4_9ACTN|nr:hypothetical protein GCM10010200_083450 [Actinomadura rugatobispora]